MDASHKARRAGVSSGPFGVCHRSGKALFKEVLFTGVRVFGEPDGDGVELRIAQSHQSRRTLGVFTKTRLEQRSDERDAGIRFFE